MSHINKSKRQRFLMLGMLMVLVGCTANQKSIFRGMNLENGNSAFIDIKQRAILVGSRGDKKVICAEPSPDSISSYLSEVNSSLEVDDKGKASVAAKFAENAAFVGLRTQSIQLLRDAYFRLCESYMNGAISANDYEIKMSRYQQNTIALLAIESLTGTVKVPQSTTLQSNLSSELITLGAKANSLQAEIIELKKDEETNKDQIVKKQGELKPVQSNYTNILTILKNTSVNKSQTQPSQDSESVTSTVSELTKEVLNTDYYGQLCWALVAKNASKSKIASDACKEFFALKNKDLSQSIALRQKSHNIKIRLINDLEKQRKHQLAVVNILKDNFSKTESKEVITSAEPTTEETTKVVSVGITTSTDEGFQVKSVIPPESAEK